MFLLENVIALQSDTSVVYFMDAKCKNLSLASVDTEFEQFTVVLAVKLNYFHFKYYLPKIE